MTRIVVKWLAARDGVAHAVTGRGFNAACGKRAVLERLAWPATGKCQACVAALMVKAA